jgi:Ca2+-binding RTX toxin-like protein
MHGSRGDDRLVGGYLLHGGSGDDVIIGNSQDNQIDGSEGKDRLFGRGGSDMIFAWLDDEPDEVDGGSESDRCYVEPIDSVVNCP